MFKYNIVFLNIFQLENWNSILVDSLINSEFLKNWESYIDLLLLDNSVNESQDRYKKLVLVDLMVYCVEQVSTGISPAPRDPDSVLKKTYVENWKESKVNYFFWNLCSKDLPFDICICMYVFLRIVATWLKFL